MSLEEEDEDDDEDEEYVEFEGKRRTSTRLQNKSLQKKKRKKKRKKNFDLYSFHPIGSTSSSKNTRSNIPHHQPDFHLQYPFHFSSEGRINLTSTDLERLAPEEFLNDTVIDFFFRFIWEHLPTIRQKKIHFFSTHFYSQLSRTGADIRNAADRYNNVQNWTNGIDFFNMDYVFVPVNDQLHWSLFVICNPGKIQYLSNRRNVSSSSIIHLDQEEEEEEEEVSSSCIIVFDSLRCHKKETVIGYLYDYLECEWERRNAGEKRKFSISNMPMISPTVPLQKNGFDCGIFSIMYARELLSRYPKAITRIDIESKLSNFNKTIFSLADVQDFRDYMLQVILTLNKLSQDGASHLSVVEELPDCIKYAMLPRCLSC